ncbi:ribokinase, putative [Anopheles sinensis]|uniref:Ribokinase, putative n=1 Tax=Anopheles sinensis TaxID=74873 RepID=A0A084WAG8_ANOSI|nr:ribokinase, putative [Anopheles sinensis]
MRNGNPREHISTCISFDSYHKTTPNGAQNKAQGLRRRKSQLPNPGQLRETNVEAQNLICAKLVGKIRYGNRLFDCVLIFPPPPRKTPKPNAIRKLQLSPIVSVGRRNSGQDMDEI